MISTRRRGHTYHADLMKGKEHSARGSLGTCSRDAAHRLAHCLEIAVLEGPNSSHWPELSKLLPRRTFLRFASLVGATEIHQGLAGDVQGEYGSASETGKSLPEYG